MRNFVIKSRATNSDIIRAIAKLEPAAISQAQKFAYKFKGPDHYTTCKNIFYYVLQNIPYVEDSNKLQVIKLPGRMIQEANKGIGSDCKSMALFCVACLKALGYPAFFKFTSYDSTPIPTHVYCVSNGIILDPVYKFFNQEKPYKSMKLVGMAGIGYIELNQNVAGISGIKETFKKVKDKLKTTTGKATGAAKTVVLAGPRNAFLLLVSINALNLAASLEKMYQKGKKTKIDTLWKKFGGDPAKLQGSVNKGKGKKPIAGKLGPKISGNTGIGVTGAEEIAAALAAATPIIIAISALFKTEGVDQAAPQTAGLAEGLQPMPGSIESGNLKEAISNTISTVSSLFTKETGTTPESIAKDVLTSETSTDSQVKNEPAEEGEEKKAFPLPLLLGGAFLAGKLLKLF